MISFFSSELVLSVMFESLKPEHPSASRYLALHNTHAPIEAPVEFSGLYHFDLEKRNTFDGMISVVDSAVANVTAALKANGNMYVNLCCVHDGHDLSLSCQQAMGTLFGTGDHRNNCVLLYGYTGGMILSSFGPQTMVHLSALAAPMPR